MSEWISVENKGGARAQILRCVIGTVIYFWLTSSVVLYNNKIRKIARLSYWHIKSIVLQWLSTTRQSVPSLGHDTLNIWSKIHYLANEIYNIIISVIWSAFTFTYIVYNIINIRVKMITVIISSQYNHQNRIECIQYYFGW